MIKNMIGLIARKEGMSRLFTEEGKSIPVTVLKIHSNIVSQIKTSEKDGYEAIQISAVDKSEKNQSKALTGHFKKNNIEFKNNSVEFSPIGNDLESLAIGSELKADIFEEGQFVDVIGTTKGKGFAGTVKRWNFATQDATHGNSLAHRKPGSIGQCQTPGRVWKGKKMSGHMGNVRQTTQNLKVQKIDLENNFILIKGAVPGPNGSEVTIKPATKKS